MSTIVHITPQLPPAIDGVGDYCWNLWKHWPEPRPEWQFAVTRGADDTMAMWPHTKVREFELNAASLRNALEQSHAATVVLHYVGYAYQPKGIPLWLPQALCEWRSGATDGNSRSPIVARRIVVMFHEMYARSSPLRSPFWVAPFAKKIIRELVALSDAWLTSCERYFTQLVTEFGARAEAGRIIPIASNIPAEAMNLDERRAENQRIVVFGLAKTRLWALERHWRFLRELSRAGLLEHITLLGKRPELDDERAWQRWADRIGSGANWRKGFNLSNAEISSELTQHDIGLLANEPDILTKSGVFAALATHGVLPIISTPRGEVLPECVQEAALANDDAEAIPSLVQSLRDTEWIKSRRERLLAFAARELHWPGIARSWSEVLPRTDGEPLAPAGQDHRWQNGRALEALV
jgi:hypothetical protein